MSFKYYPFTKKQLQLLTWWNSKSPVNLANGVIAEGAVRSGKTLIMGISYTIWSMQSFENQQFAICGKTIQSLRRNVITPLKEALRLRGYKVIDRQSEQALVIRKGKVRNTYYLFGGRDERSQDLIQGVTLAGILLDEVALMPRSFVEQAMARCSVEGAKFWFNCNPEGPKHWFYVEHVLKYEEKNYIRIHFMLEDNPSLSKSTIERYYSMFTGVFYKRFILGEWAFANGVIYDCFTKEKNTLEGSNFELPWQVKEKQIHPFYGSDYGTHNPQVFLKVWKFRKEGERVPYFYVEKEYYWNSVKQFRQKTDQEYVQDFDRFNGEERYASIIVDPSATSLIAALKQTGHITRQAKNDVLPGIRMVHSLMSMGHIIINEEQCPNLIDELGVYSWDEKKVKLGQDAPIKENDHACDALRYAITTSTSDYEVYSS